MRIYQLYFHDQNYIYIFIILCIRVYQPCHISSLVIQMIQTSPKLLTRNNLPKQLKTHTTNVKGISLVGPHKAIYIARKSRN